MRWTRTKAEVEPKVGGKYSIYEGKIIGKFLEFVFFRFFIIYIILN